jgi:Ribosomal protein S7e
VVVVTTRRIVRPPKKGSAVIRPRTRTLTAVHDGILEDVVYPAEIVGKRVRYRLDGSKIIKVHTPVMTTFNYFVCLISFLYFWVEMNFMQHLSNLIMN